MASAEAAINAVEGLTATTKSDGTYSGWVYERWNSARVTLNEGYEVSQWNELLVWLIGEVWSMNEDKPNQGVIVMFTFAERKAFEEWQTKGEQSGLPDGYSVRVRDIENNPRVIVAVYDHLTKKAGLGRWPGEVPVLPENVVVKIADG